MEATFSGLGHRLAVDWPLAGAVFCALAVVWGLMRRSRLHASERMRDRRVLKEMEAYAALDVRVPDGDVRGLGVRVCRVVAEVSAFRRVATMTRDAEGRLFVAGSAGMDDLTVAGLNRWGERWTRSAGAGGRAGGDEVGCVGGAGVEGGDAEFCVGAGWGVGGDGSAVDDGWADAGGGGGVWG